MPKPTFSGKHPNRLLAALRPDEFALLVPQLQRVALERRQILGSDGSSGRVYFPWSAVASMVTTMQDGSSVEVATVGNEGLIGLPETVSMDVRVQVPGEASALADASFREALREGGSLRRVVRRYSQALLGHIAQSAACNGLHSVAQRCARWFLATHDRIVGDEYPITQESLSEMLGVRRASVTAAATSLQRAGYIRYGRGVLRIVDRSGLEAATCECYRVIRVGHDRVIAERVIG